MIFSFKIDGFFSKKDILKSYLSWWEISINFSFTILNELTHFRWLFAVMMNCHFLEDWLLFFYLVLLTKLTELFMYRWNIFIFFLVWFQKCFGISNDHNVNCFENCRLWFYFLFVYASSSITSALFQKE